jgi:hypothetical protein
MEKQIKRAQEVSALLNEVGNSYLHQSQSGSYARAVGYYEYLLWAVAAGLVKPRDIHAELAKKIGQFNDKTEQ